MSGGRDGDVGDVVLYGLLSSFCWVLLYMCCRGGECRRRVCVRSGVGIPSFMVFFSCGLMYREETDIQTGGQRVER